MSDREALAAALAKHDEWAEDYGTVVHPTNRVIAAAARERLAQLPETCGTCVVPVQGLHQCPTCHGRGTVYKKETVEVVVQALMAADDVSVEYLIEQYAYEVKAKYLVKAVAVLDALNETEAK